jgi:hypothetical protein
MFYMDNFHILRLLPNWIYGMYIGKKTWKNNDYLEHKKVHYHGNGGLRQAMFTNQSTCLYTSFVLFNNFLGHIH